MALYEFKCKTCDTIEEVNCPISEYDRDRIAPVCCRQKMIRIIGNVRYMYSTSIKSYFNDPDEQRRRVGL